MKYKNCIKVYVPVRESELKDRVALRFINDSMIMKFGGTTASRSNEGFGFDRGIIYRDEIIIITSFTNKSKRAIKKIAAEYVEFIKTTLKQITVWIEINNRLYIL